MICHRAVRVLYVVVVTSLLSSRVSADDPGEVPTELAAFDGKLQIYVTAADIDCLPVSLSSLLGYNRDTSSTINNILVQTNMS